MTNAQSPREKLIKNFKNICGTSYYKMFLSDLSEDLIMFKLKCYVESLILLLDVDLQLKTTKESISLFNDVTLINSYSKEYVTNINNEKQLGLSLFIEWGNLLNLTAELKEEQLMLVL
ncbi:hypothetical protein [uncultured Clostridium sp.]|uniref:hypothetical protein n=1 Tax=uncultured Clostridium sp. TaxID=59620 RepID=UPI0028F0C8EC|nr:hypothetical protein [uncultured Clostridium sp.]